MPDNNHNNNNNNKAALRVPRNDLTKPMEAGTGIEAIRGAQNLIRQFGKQVEPALYALLCDTQSETRLTVDKALKTGGQAATAVLVPLLISQFSIAPAMATMVAAVTLQAIATVGQEKLCKALAESASVKVLVASKVQAAPTAAPSITPTHAKPATVVAAEVEPGPVAETLEVKPKRRGRPKGSKNKVKAEPKPKAKATVKTVAKPRATTRKKATK